jgi:hypothetical protein
MEEKVAGEKTKAKGSPTLATGGTWELIGKVTTGVAVVSPVRSKAVAQATTSDAMVVTVEMSLLPLLTVDHCIVEGVHEITTTGTGGSAEQDNGKGERSDPPRKGVFFSSKTESLQGVNGFGPWPCFLPLGSVSVTIVAPRRARENYPAIHSRP